MPVVRHVVIAAAGLGSRLGLGKPKCLVEINGKPAIAHQLACLSHVPDVRIVVGFGEEEVIAAARSIRSDIIFVRNPGYRITTTLHSYGMGSRFLEEACLYMDADILFDPITFQRFLDACTQGPPLIAVTAAKTSDCVYAHRREDGSVSRFSRTDPAPYEWANLAWLPPRYFEEGDGAVFERLADDVPIPALEIVSHEFDTDRDLAAARAAAQKRLG